MRLQIASPSPVPPYIRVVEASACENALNSLLQDAHPGVAHFEAQLMMGAGFAEAADVDRDRAAFGELERVADQVADNLPYPQRVAAHSRTYVRCDVQRQSKALDLRLPFEQPDHRIEQFAQVDVDAFKLQPVGFELGVIEDVIDDAQQLVRRLQCDVEHLALVRCELGRLQQVEHRDDAVERRAHLVAHRGEELALGQHRRLGGQLGLGQLALQSPVFLDLVTQRVEFGDVLGSCLADLGLDRTDCTVDGGGRVLQLPVHQLQNDQERDQPGRRQRQCHPAPRANDADHVQGKGKHCTTDGDGGDPAEQVDDRVRFGHGPQLWVRALRL